MKILLSTLAMLGLLTAIAVADGSVAFADDATPAEAADSAANPCAPPAANPCAPPAANPCAPPAANPCAPPPDCASLEGDAQADCLAKNAAPPPEKTGKNMTKSNDNRMESYDSDE